MGHGLILVPSSLYVWEAFRTPGPSPTLGSVGPLTNGATLRGPPCGHDVLNTPYGEVRDTLVAHLAWSQSASQHLFVLGLEAIKSNYNGAKTKI